MPQYAIIGSHPPDNCPIGNKSVRDFLMGMAPKWPELGQELGVKTLSWLHLDPNHKSFQLFEASNTEAVRDFLYRGGQAQLCRDGFSPGHANRGAHWENGPVPPDNLLAG